MPTPHLDLHRLLDALLPQLVAVQRGAWVAEAPKLIPIVVPSRQFADWLQTRIARLTGLCMGFEFLQPKQFIERILRLEAAAGDGNPSASSAWSPERLAWRLLPHMQDYAGALGLTSPEVPPRDRFALARLVADRFDQYGHFRPQIFRSWTKGHEAPATQSKALERLRQEERWQRELWLKLKTELDALAQTHPALLVESLATAGGSKAGAAAFPTVFAIGIGTLDPLLVELLLLLKQSGCTVHTHAVLPSLGYLEDLKRSGGLASTPPADSEEGTLGDGNPLLVSLGRQAIGAFQLMARLDEDFSDWSDPSALPQPCAPEASLLNRIQEDVRALRLPGSAGIPDFKPSDLSLRAHACHGPRREIEVLRDELLRAFKELPSLTPEEVLIVAPDLQAYAPYVESILQRGSPPLPVRLTERPATERNPLAEGLAAVLDFARGRWPASGLVELLHLRAARRHLGILDDDKALGQLRAWIKASGLTEEPASERAWRAARDRLLAGFWFGPDTLTRYPSSEYALPVSGDLEGVDPLRAAFLLWHSRLEELLRAWKPPATPAAWAGRLWQACEVLFSGDESEDDLPELSRMLDPLAAQACDTLVDCGTLLDWMTLQSEGHSAARSSFTGEITFGRFVQLQNQPCRVLAMVGMQEGAFPRQSRTPAWDLLQLEPRLWDRNPRIEDRQLFLDALLCPTDRLIITAGVQNLRSGKEEPFSACVDELLRVAAATMRLEPGERELEQDRLIFRHRLQPFSAAYFSEGSRLPRSFSNDQLAIAEAVATPGRREGSKPFFDAATAPAPQAPAELSLDALIAFWKDPARGWLTAQGITLPRDEEDEQEWDRPPLSVNGLQAWGVRQRILDEALLGSKAPTRLLLTADRQLPPGALGENAWTNLHTGAQQIAREVLALKPVRVPVDLVVPVARDRSLRLTGSLCQGEDQGVPRLVSYSPGKMDTQKAGLAAWLQALAAAAAGLKAPSLLIGEELYTKGKRFDAPAIPKQEALLGLASLVKGFLEGGDRPLCYAPATSERYAASLEEGFIFDPDRLRAAAESLWSPEGGYVSGEGLTPAAQLAWRDQDPFSIDGEPCLAEAWHAWAECIALPLLQWRKSPKDPHA